MNWFDFVEDILVVGGHPSTAPKAILFAIIT
jgi:hypothetical protein